SVSKCSSKALEVIEKGLSLKPNDSSLMEVKILLLEEFFSEQLLDQLEYLKLLALYYRNEEYPSFDLVFKYACLCFKLGYYSDAKKVFYKLSRIMKSAKYSIRMSDEDDRLFIGNIETIKNRQTGYIRSTDPRVGYSIFFHPFHTSEYLRRGELVQFNVIFTPFGLRGINIKRRE
ncbi:MAG: hypothetical protein ACXADY_25290, partial [Candidatus Hodarchaeales archaeon]